MTRTKNSLELTHEFAASRARVFEAWTRKEQMGWFSPIEMRVTAAEGDVKVGGNFRMSMKGEDGKVHTCYGTYEEIVPNERLVFTHQWEGENPVETLVTVEFEDKAGDTEVTLQQEGFVDPEEAKGHEEGWMSAFEHLDAQLTKASSSAGWESSR